MITQVDEALCLLIAPHLPEGTVVRLDPPKPTWQTETRVSSVDLFLFALHGAGPGTGAVRAKRCELSYLVTARADKVRDEHTLLGRSLRALLGAEFLMVGEQPLRMALGETDPTGLWVSLGLPARAAFVVTVTAEYRD
ncbi:hypothetical protein DL991_37610 [Amycolatopsis sp. WAC 01375]|uniref:hypothetical protein n=1 Tax=unclassified Amycolatopsis TaxID=2618356 RepID=UPI000F7A8E56|nr:MULTISPECIES: hypothetical protein [unclassified Amycolatopsis]RSM71381.1 hypothetical protein DL991_37610 [Amycolatopsis sp. WAC 01375]RSN36164.1 hypothetical protein DL990_08505 [Amycolatopsis sp. WAC 01416]